MSASDRTDGLTALKARMRSDYASLSAAERKVADVILEQPTVLELPLGDLARRVGVSEASVVRFCQTIGYAGLRDLKRHLSAPVLSPPTSLLSLAVEAGDDLDAVAEKVVRFNIDLLSDTLQGLDRAALSEAVNALLDAQRIECYAIGSSVSIAQDAYYRLLRLGLPVSAVSDPHMQATSAAQLPPGSVAFAISQRGRSSETAAALRWAGRAGATRILLTSYRNTPLSRLADIQLTCAAPDASLRPEALAARVAHLAVVDVISVAIALKRPEAANDALLRDDAIITDRDLSD
jgi:RpiR family carbohydrate utilization transcriptional regulator